MRHETTWTAALVIALASLLTFLTGCGGAADADRAYTDGSGTPTDSAGTGTEGSSSDTSSSASDRSSSSDDSSSSESSSDQEGSSQDKDPEAGQLTAGEWRDLDNWSFWLDLFGQQQSEEDDQTSVDWTTEEERWSIYTRNRIGVRVVSGQKPVVDAEVKLKNQQGEVIWTARTDNHGRAEVFEGFASGQTSSGSLTVTAQAGGQEAVAHQVTPAENNDRVILTMEKASAPSENIDVMFAIDTTGSMGDELSYLQSELKDVMRRSREESGRSLDMRLSVNLYRDEGDDYVVKSFPFRSNVGDAISDLESEGAAGGGDFPEAVDQALADAIDGHEWRSSAAARLLFLVLDAPPHTDQDVMSRYRDAVKAAAEKGVRIVPVTGSGIDKKTEYLMRASGIATGGTYTFLTDHSGIGGSHIEPTIGDYDVQYLNDLLVDIISRHATPVESVAPDNK